MIAPGDPITSLLHDGKLVQGIVTQVEALLFLWRQAYVPSYFGRPQLQGPPYPEALSQEGVTWCRGWEGAAVLAFKAGCAL